MVLDEGKSGIFGLGGSKVQVRVSSLEATSEIDLAEAEGVLRQFVDFLGIQYKLETKQEEDRIRFQINSEDGEGLLIGRRGQTLDALKHLTQRVLTARANQNMSIEIEVGDYRERREEALKERAREAAQEVLEKHKSISLEPMSAQDRRVVHMEVSDSEQLRTYTVGDGNRRRVVIAFGEEGEESSAYDGIPDPGFQSTRVSSEGNQPDQGGRSRDSRGRRGEGRERSRSDNRSGGNDRSRGENRSRRNDRPREERSGERRSSGREDRRPRRDERDSAPRDSQGGAPMKGPLEKIAIPEAQMARPFSGGGDGDKPSEKPATPARRRRYR